MKQLLYIIFLSLFIPNTTTIWGQSLVGYWKIKEFIWNTSKNEYTLYEHRKVEKAGYGNRIQFNEDGTFRCSYSAPCGNDCFPFSSGNYRILDNNYIEIIVNYISQDGFCEEINEEGNWNLGNYYMYFGNGGICKLVKSSNTIDVDKQKAIYTAMIDTYMIYYFIINRNKTYVKTPKESPLQELLKTHLSITNYKVIAKRQQGVYDIFLVKNLDKNDDYWIFNIYKDGSFYYNYKELKEKYFK